MFRGHDKQLNRRVAIKVMKRGMDPDVLRREARIMAAFQHPGLPTVHAMGTHHGVAYLVMEYLYGQTLQAHIKHIQPILSLEETRRVMLAVADSLQLLHGAQLAHRDLKPANIMMVPPDRVVLMDFGIADVERYASQMVVGSPHYMAPEVASGKLQSGAAHLTDIYSLGVIGYQLLTGRKPFQGENIAELLSNMISQDAPAIHELRPDLPSDMAALINDMTHKDPTMRPLSIELVSARLRAMDLDGSVSAAPAEEPTPNAVRILAADDEPRIWELMAYVFEDRGYDITFVEDGEQALNEFARNHFDIVIADKNMPKLDGLELLVEIKKLRPVTDVVLITGYPSMDAAVAALNSGAVRFIQKPFDIDDLAQIIDNLASKHMALRVTQSLDDFLHKVR